MVSQKKAEMFARVAEWERSSMSVVAFAQTCGIGERKFYYWVQKVREASMSSDDKAEFIEIGVSTPPTPYFSFDLMSLPLLKIYR